MLRTLSFSCKFIAITEGSIVHRVRKTIRFGSHFHRHLALQREVERNNTKIFT